MKNSRLRVMHCRVILALGCLAAADGARAAGACSISSTGLAFGSYQPLTFAGKLLSSDKTSWATISVVCTAIAVGGAYTISLGPGNYGAGNRITNRYLNNTNGGDYMLFNVYTDGAYTIVWGGAGAGSTLNGSILAGSTNQSLTVYGKVPGGQHTLKAGSYSDSMVMTITYVP
ncbi:MAG: Spore coat domain protein [Massilia sp.]|jgi:spore coat protein U-like protein|nr:Spore coat domain protein [Massilia sp.]